MTFERKRYKLHKQAENEIIELEKKGKNTLSMKFARYLMRKGIL